MPPGLLDELRVQLYGERRDPDDDPTRYQAASRAVERAYEQGYRDGWMRGHQEAFCEYDRRRRLDQEAREAPPRND